MDIITIERSAIDRLKSSWPCHGISNRVDYIVAAFADNGDLVDFEVCDADDIVLGADAYDGEAFSALINDAQRDAVEPRIIPGTIPLGRIYK